MKAAVLYGKTDLRYEDYTEPKMGSSDVLVRILVNGICGSDIHFFHEGKLGPFIVDSPYIPGHEAIGVVEQIGACVPDTSLVGKRVIVEPGIPCGSCSFCKTGRYNLCQTVKFLSAPPIDGTFTDFAVIPWDFVHPVPDNVSDEEGALVEPAAVAAHALNRLGASPGTSLTILGAGPIGLITMLVARSYGVSTIVMVDVSEYRINKARELGATHVFDNSRMEAVDQILKLTNGAGTDFVIDTTGSSKACMTAPMIASRGGRIALVGWPETGSFPYPIEMVMEKELDVVGINRYCNVFPEILSLLGSGRLSLKQVITHEFAFNEIVEAFDFAYKNRNSSLKILVRHGDVGGGR